MENYNAFPLSAGFLFPNGEFYSNLGQGHQKNAYRILRDTYRQNILEIDDPENVLQKKYHAILIRYRWGEKLIYLPEEAPKTYQECEYFREAVNFYLDKGFQIINVNKISLEFETGEVKNFIGEVYEKIKIFSYKNNYTQTIIQDKTGKYMYNPERVGD